MTQPDLHRLLQDLAAQEDQLRTNRFLAPCVRGGRLRVKLAGMVYTLVPQPRDFEGWAFFQPLNAKEAAVVEVADRLAQISDYLQPLPAFRLRLAYPLRHATWLAYPVNAADFQQRLGRSQPVPVHLVTEGLAFEQIVARWDGQSFWFEELDRRADPILAERLRTALQTLTPPEELNFPGRTPELLSVYEVVAQQHPELGQPHRDQRRLQQALQLGGGQMQTFQDQGDYWRVEWTTATGERQVSAIAKQDLTVISAGICLSDRDRDFDLQSLVGVVEGRRDWD